jgi:hypothetical protein
MLLNQLNAINEIAASQWDALLTDAQPFLRHAFLSALEDSGSVGGRSGWQPAHGVFKGAQGQLLAAMPGYVKSHSYGEYVFEHGWADACHRAGSSGTSISFAGEDDAYALPAIEALLGRKIACEMPPDELLKPVPRKH